MNDRDLNSSRILEESRGFLKTISRIYEERNYGSGYCLNTFGGDGNMKQMLRIIKEGDDTKEKLQQILATYLFSHNCLDAAMVRLQLDWWIAFLSNEYRLTLDTLAPEWVESNLANPATCEMRKGRLLSPDFFRHLTCSFEIQKHCKFQSDAPRLLELGAGYGGMARILKTLYPNARYTIIDIPESLFFSSLFLRMNFPNAKVRYVTLVLMDENRKSELQKKRMLFESDSLESLREQILQHGVDESPKLIEHFYGYNLVDYKRSIYSIPVTLGQVNLTLKNDREKQGILISASIEEAKMTVARNIIALNSGAPQIQERKY